MRYGVWCERSADSRLGYAANWLNDDGVREEFDTIELAQKRARDITDTMSPSLWNILSYTAKELPT